MKNTAAILKKVFIRFLSQEIRRRSIFAFFVALVLTPLAWHAWSAKPKINIPGPESVLITEVQTNHELITIKGIGFTDDPLVMLGEFGELNLESASDTLIQAYIPAGATPGDYLLTVMPISNPEMASNFALTISAAPSHLIAFFAMDECPSGWSELAEAQGRVIVGLPDGGTSFGLVGSALADLENRNHDHSFNFNGGNTANAGSHNHVGTAAANGAHDHGATTGITNGTFAADDTGGFVTETVTVDHNHTIDPSVTHEHVVSTEDNGSHSHSFDGGAGNTGDASTSMVMPYLQLLACEKD